MLNRTGAFLEKRITVRGFDNTDRCRALNTLRYIHANPKAAGMQQGFFYDFSNYGIYDRLGDDGLTQWHPAFLKLGKTLDECAKKYRGFCKKYKASAETREALLLGSKLLPKLAKGKGKKSSPGQAKLSWADWDASDPEIIEVAEKFV
jgi:putative transposase